MMDINRTQSSSCTPYHVSTVFPPLEKITRPTVTTEEAAYYLSRRPQTLRGWACHQNGPVRPLRINGRLAWPVCDLRKLLGAI